MSQRSPLRSLTPWFAAAVLLFPLRSSDATTVVALDDAALARGARTIIHGDVVAKRSQVEPGTGRIFTEYRFVARDMLKGESGADGAVVFREWGGEAGGVKYWIPGVNGYSVGEEVVAFLGEADPRTGVGLTYGLAQGKFTVERDPATRKATVRRELGELELLPPPGGAAPAPAPERERSGRDLDAFKAKIRAEARK